MSGSQGLSLNDVVQITATFQAQSTPVRNFNSLLIIGPSDVIPLSQRVALYTSDLAIADDFGEGSPENQAAELLFDQQPGPGFCYIGRWSQTASASQLAGAPLGITEQQALVTLLSTTTAGQIQMFTSKVAGSSVVDAGLLASHNYAAQGITTMPQLASYLTSIATAASVAWNSGGNFFVVSTNATGTAAFIAAASTAFGGGIADAMGIAADQSPAISQGAAAETPVQALQACMNASGAWYGSTFAPTAVGDITASQYQSLAALTEATGSGTTRILGITSQDGNALQSTSTTDLPYLLSQAGFMRSTIMYSSSNPYAVVSMIARGFVVNFNAVNTAMTLFGKTCPGLTPETISETQAQTLLTKHCNVFVNYANAKPIIQDGVMCNGFYFDEVQGVDAFCNALQLQDWNELTTTLTKIPQTDAGTHVLVTGSNSVCQKFVDNGYIGTGLTWTGPSFGSINTGDTLPAGFYVYAPTVASQDQASRSQRQAVPRQIAVTLAGAVHRTSILVDIVR